MNLSQQLRLYAVTDRAWLNGRSLADCVAQAIDGGVTFVQLREKHGSWDEKLSLAKQLKQVCNAAEVPFVINDDVALAKEVDADGVHVGQDDMTVAQARSILGPNKIVGLSVQTLQQALCAQEEGADYLGVGALIATSTKPDAVHVTRDELRSICSAVEIPVVGIGGLNANTISDFSGCGLAGVAVVSALFAAQDIKAAAEELRNIPL